MKRLIFPLIVLLPACSWFERVDDPIDEPADATTDTPDSNSDAHDATHDSTVDSTDAADANDANDASSDSADTHPDTRADSSDSGDTEDAADTECTPTTVDTEACGKCGTHSRTCGSDGTWGAFGACGGEGPCAPGDVTTVSGSCPSVGDVQQETCTSACAWGAPVCVTPSGWRGMSASPLAGRCNPAFAWTGSKLIVWGGSTRWEGGTTLNDGAIYDVSSDSWTTMVAPPTGFVPRRLFASGWAGTEFIVWGGVSDTSVQEADGISYDPSAGTWKTISAAPLSGRQNSIVTYGTTSGSLLIWGGQGSGSTPFADGAGYIPFSDRWASITASPLAARWTCAVAFTGGQEIIFGGTDGGGSFFSDGARYNPVANTWTALDAPPLGYVARIYPAWAGINGSLVTYGGVLITGVAANDGLAYDGAGHPTTITTPSTAALNPPDRYGSVMWCNDSASKCWVWGGASATSATTAVLDGTGAAFTYPALVWTAMPTAGAPTARVYASSAWTGKSGIVWGGLDDTTTGATCANSGALYTP